MFFEEHYFQKKSVDLTKLRAFGFEEKDKQFFYQSPLLDGSFEARLVVDDKGHLSGQVIDCDFDEPYDTFRSEQAQGPFVGQVREAYGNLLEEIAQKCYQTALFQWQQANRLVTSIKEVFQDTYDHPFEKYPDYLTYRVAGKWYALFFPVKGEKLGLSGARAQETYDVVNIKVPAQKMSELLEKPGIYPSYHMSKKTWVSVVLDDSLTDAELLEFVRQSRSLVAPAHLRQNQEPHYWIIPVNIKYYDIREEFTSSQDILWTQKASMQRGDYVAIYLTAPTKALGYLCQVLEANIPNQGYRDQASIKELMRIKPIHHFEDQAFNSERLKALGIKTVRGPRHMTDELVSALSPYLPKSQGD